MHIPSWPQASQRDAELLHAVLKSPQWGGFHPLIAEFEESFAAYQHSKFGISAFNGTVTLELALTVLGIGPGDEVIVPAISFIATASAVSRVGATPVFVDIGPESFNVDPERLEEAISEKTRAVVAVHFGGTMCDMQALERICSPHKLHLIEDAAHAHGSEWNGRRAGSFGVAGSFSFQNGKVLSSGEGGMLVSSDADFATRARSIANCGRTPGRSFYNHDRLGTNFRLTAFQAAVLIAGLERLPRQIALRTTNVNILRNELREVEEIVWQKQPDEVTANCFYLLVGRCNGGAAMRDRLCEALKASGITVTPFYPHTLYRNGCYGEVASRVMRCPESEERVKDSFWIPHQVLLADEDTIREIGKLMREALSARVSVR